MAKLVNEKPQLPKLVNDSSKGLFSVFSNIIERLSTYLSEYAFRINRVYPKDGSENMDFISLASSISAPVDSSSRVVVYVDEVDNYLKAKLTDNNVYVLAPPILNVKAVSSTYTALISDDVILAKGAITVNLYTAIGNKGRNLYIKNNSATTLTVDGLSAEPIDESPTQVIITKFDAVHIVADGSVGWHII